MLFPEVIFPHPDLVTSVDFHPTHTQDVVFVSGCMDKKIRVWTVLPVQQQNLSAGTMPSKSDSRYSLNVNISSGTAGEPNFIVSGSDRQLEGRIKEWANVCTNYFPSIQK